MIRVRIEAHPSVEPSKVVITVRAMGDGATLCASGMLILCARQAKQPRLRALFWTLFFLSFLQSLHFFWFVLVCFSAAVYCFICFVFYLIFQGQWNWGWFEASSEGKRAIFDWVKSSSIQLMVQLRSSGLLVVLPISGTWESLAHLLIDHILVPSLPTNGIRIGTLKLCGAVFIIIIIIFPLLFQRIRFESGY